VPCGINVFSGCKRERSPLENLPNDDFGGFSHGDLSPRQAKIPQTGGAKGRQATIHQNQKFGGFSRGDLLPRHAKIRHTEDENATHGLSRTFVWRGERSPCENTKKSPFGGFFA